MKPDKLKALAADLEDVLMRFRGNFDDGETIRRVIDDMLAAARRYIAEFHPQAWIRDSAYPVDPEGPTRWDATEFVQALLSGKEPLIGSTPQGWLADTLDHGDHVDILRTDPNAPEWVREWSGPFDTMLVRED